MDSQGQEIEFGLMSSQEQDNYHKNHFQNFHGQSIAYFFYEDEENQRKQDAPTGIVSDKSYQEPNQIVQKVAQSEKKINNQGLFKMKQQRSKKYIQISRRTKQKYIICKKGNKRQTSLLNINLKTFFTSLLKQYLVFNKTTKYQQQRINEFLNSKANFYSFQKLYGIKQINHKTSQKLVKQQNFKDTNKQKSQNTSLINFSHLTISSQQDNLRKYLLQKFQKGEFISKILSNKKMSYQNKLSIFKFANQIRKSCINPENFTNWKTSNIF